MSTSFRSFPPFASLHRLGAPFAAVVVAALLAGCGGGGSSEPPPPTTPFNVAAAVTGIATANETFTLSGSILGQAATLSASHQAMPNAPFMNYGMLNAFRRTATLSTGANSTTSYEDDFIDLNARTFYGMQDDMGNRALSTARYVYPATATIGTNGMLYEALHVDNTGTTIGQAHVYWSLESAGSDTTSAYLCLNTEFQDPQGRPTGDYEADCYRITPSGQRTGMKITLTTTAFGTIAFQ